MPELGDEVLKLNLTSLCYSSTNPTATARRSGQHGAHTGWSGCLGNPAHPSKVGKRATEQSKYKNNGRTGRRRRTRKQGTEQKQNYFQLRSAECITKQNIKHTTPLCPGTAEPPRLYSGGVYTFTWPFQVHPCGGKGRNTRIITHYGCMYSIYMNFTLVKLSLPSGRQCHRWKSLNICLQQQMKHPHGLSARVTGTAVTVLWTISFPTKNFSCKGTLSLLWQAPLKLFISSLSMNEAESKLAGQHCTLDNWGWHRNTVKRNRRA